MPFDANGIWTRPVDPDTGAEYNFTADLAAGEPRSIVEAPDMDAHFDDLKVALSETFLRDGRAPMTGNLKVGSGADTTETRQINVGVDRTGNGYSLINLIGDATYPIYGARLVRHNGGPDALTTLDTRGTGGLRISVQEAGAFSVRTTNIDRFRIRDNGDAEFFGTGTEARAVKVGYNRSGDGQSRLDFISSAANHVGLTVVREAGVNGSGYIQAFGAAASGWWVDDINSSFQVWLGPSAELIRLLIDSNDIYLGWGATGTETARVGGGRTADGDSSINLIGDSTYTVYGAQFIREAGANGGTNIKHRGTGSLVFIAVDAANIVFQTNSISRMRIYSDGRTEWGVFSDTGASAGFQVQGSVPQRRNSSATSTSSTVHLGFYNPNGVVGSVSTSSTSTSFSTSSDRRLKTNIVDFVKAVDILEALQVREFEFKKNPGVKNIGLIAQEAMKIYDRNVSEIDGWLGLDYSQYTPILIGGWQNHERRISDLEREVALLRG